MADENKIRDAADAVKGVLEAVPVYEDVVQPAAQELGKGLQTIAKLVNVALAPVAMVVWGYDQIRDYLQETLAERLKNVPPEQIVQPRMIIAGPVVEQLRFAADEPSLRELYANLLATSMDARTTQAAHPAFVEIIRQVTPDEARLFAHIGRPFSHRFMPDDKNMGYPAISGNVLVEKGDDMVLFSFRHFSLLGREANCEYPDLFPTYIVNLVRLGLIEILDDSDEDGSHSTHKHLEKEMKRNARERYQAQTGKRIKSNTKNIHLVSFRKWIFPTTLGRQFYDACISEHDVSNN